MDAISMLKEDHKKVKSLFRDFERASGDGRRQKLAQAIIKELSVHAALEEQIFYPAARETLDSDDIVLESLEEHHVVKWTLSELAKMTPADERFDAKVSVLMENVRNHIKEEEEQLFPEMRERLGRKRLQEIGEAIATAKPMAPTRPHPRVPDSPPANIPAGLAGGAADKILDLATGAVRTITSKVREKSNR
jgi:hemerythrin superfamily protein